jgi:hypothetical protein
MSIGPSRAGFHVTFDGNKGVDGFCQLMKAGRLHSKPRPVPPPNPRPPASHMATVFFVVHAERTPQSRLFIEDYKQMHTESDCRGDHNAQQTRVPEYNPKPDPPSGPAHVNRVAHVTVEARNYQSLRRCKRGGRSASYPTEVPDAACGNGEPQHGQYCRYPTPTCCVYQLFYGKPKPLRNKPKPNGEERSTCG